jgi:hypothetical protein
MSTRISTATIRQLAADGKLQYVDGGHRITLRAEQIAGDDQRWELIETPGYNGPGAYIDSQTGDMWRVCVHMGDHPRQIMEAGIIRASIAGEALWPYLPHLVVRPLAG